MNINSAVTVDPQQPRADRYFVSDKVFVNMTRATLIDAIVKMVVKEGASLRFFSSDGCMQALGGLAQKVGVSMDRDMVGKYVMDAAERLKKKMTQELDGKFVYLKFDCATRIHTNYIGLNVRYIDSQNNPVTKTLMVADTHAQHTSSELRVHLNRALEEFGIPWSRVLCCVTDNATNMVKLVKDCNKELAAEAAAADAAALADSTIEDISGRNVFQNYLIKL
jgi:hypothetical protein